MKSVQINEYGGSEIIKVNQSSSEPTVSTGKVLVTIKADWCKSSRLENPRRVLPADGPASIPINLGDGFFWSY